jgi:4-alpha-glucanotransferase
MRVGIYLDLAVGVSPDGAAAWSDRALFASRARIGAPPDMFNHLGQDWGLAPMKPANLLERQFEPFERELMAAMRSAGAVRLDHVMSLARLYWLPAGTDARDGGYVRYPIEHLLRVLGRCSQETQCIVIGEDLGTVPPGFRDIMRAHKVLSYRVFYFERGDEGRFNAAQHYPAEAMACIATHDLPPLRGWWEGRDIEARVGCGMYENSDAVQGAYNERAHARWLMLQALREAGAFGDDPAPESSEGALHEDLFIAAHRYMARTPCRLFALQLEDIAGAVDMVNLPGTDRQHANWRRKLPVLIEALPALETLRRTVEAVARERPRQV